MEVFFLLLGLSCACLLSPVSSLPPDESKDG